jgi:hypothetical protein
MNRRDFFRHTIIGGVAAAAAVREWPFRVFSFPSKVEPALAIRSVRFVRAFDPIRGRMINQWDALFGFGGLNDLQLPPSIEIGELVRGPLKESDIETFKLKCAREYNLLSVPPIPTSVKSYDSKAILVGWDAEA